MRSVNKVILIGNVGNAPELKYTPRGTAVANISLATNERWKDDRGEKQERVVWHRLIFWAKLAEVVSEYVKKGDPLYIEGRIDNREYEKDGETRYASEVIVEQMNMLGAKKA